MNPLQDMKRIDFDHINDTMEDLLYHLARYKFVGRQLRRSWDVLEVGCGTGYGAHFLAPFVGTINACDLDTRLLVRAKEKYHRDNLIFSEHPIKQDYDAVICLEVIEHMTKEAGVKLLDYLNRFLKKGGLLFISTPRRIDNPSENRKKYHLHEYTAVEFIQQLETRFTRALLFSQNDELISSQNPENAWNYLSICFKA